MALLNKLFRKNKEFKATCAISKEPAEKGYSYLLNTAEIISSEKFWENKMTEPETLSYTMNYFKKKDEMSSKIRNMIFDKYANVGGTWLVSESYINLFDVDKKAAKVEAEKWWDSKGTYQPDNIGTGKDLLSAENYDEIKKYAVSEAGKHVVESQSA